MSIFCLYKLFIIKFKIHCFLLLGEANEYVKQNIKIKKIKKTKIV